MPENNTEKGNQLSKPTSSYIWSIVIINVVLIGVLFVMAHRLGWTLGWLYIGVYASQGIITIISLALWNPVLIGRRMQIDPGTKVWDIVFFLIFVAIMIAIFLVAKDDLAIQGENLPGVWWLIGTTIFISGWMLVTWAMVVNPFFEKTVRIQTEHGHHVIDKGPYAYVRHPGYTGFCTLILATPLMLSSAVTLIPTLIAVFTLLIRTIFEDRTLKAELSSYNEYAMRVRYRLIPGIW